MMEVKFGPEFEKSWKKMQRAEMLRPFNPKEWYREVKYFIQRGRRGYSDRDLWNADQHIAEVVLAFLKLEQSGYPADLSEKKWDEYKGELRWMMERHLDFWETPVEVIVSGRYQERMKKANRLFGKYWMSLWD